MPAEPRPARRARGLSSRAHDAALAAAVGLLREGGLPAATVDAVAARSGVSKATLYKHWPSRIALASEAFGIEMADAIPLPDTGSARGDLVEQAVRVSAFYASHEGRVFAQLLAAGVTDPEGAAAFREYFLTGRRIAIAELWSRAVERGEARAGVDAETATDVLFGPLVFRAVSGHAPLTRAEAERIAAAALDGLLEPGPRHSAPG